MHLLTLNVAGKQLAPPREITKRRRRLSQVIGRHVDRTRPHMIAIQNARDPLQPLDEAWITRGWKVPPVLDAQGNTITPGVVKPWPRRYLRHDDIVVVVYLPRGGTGGASGGSRSKSPLSVALMIAAVVLITFANPIGGAIAGAVGVTSAFGVAAITAGVVVAGSALMGLASKSNSNKAPTDETKVYGINGGGNLPRPGDRIPRGYGRHWMKPDLSQPDFNQYDGDDLILTKRHTLGVGRYHIYALRAGKQNVWKEGEGFIAPFNDARNKVEFLYGEASTLAPSNVISATGIGGELPRLEDTIQYSGPFFINQRGALVNRLQVDFQFPSGISRIDYLKSGSVRSNQPGEWGVQFEYASIDEGGNIISPYQILYSGNSGNEGSRFATHPLRFTKFKDVPPGRYAVRGVNVAKDTSALQTGAAHQNTANWDAASGWVGDTVIRPGITEVVARLYATKASGNAPFGELEVDAGAIIPVWTGTEWVEQETSKAVWAFCDVMRNQDYGGGLPDNQVDRTIPLYYANALAKFDTFDGTIRGPVSVYDAASTVLLPMRAEPVHLGRFWSLVRDDTKNVRKHLITRRQMLKGSTRISFDLDTGAGAAHVIGEYDRDGDYRNPGQCTAVYGEASLTPIRTKWTGVKTYEHGLHLTRWRAAIGAYRRQSIPFGVSMESRIYKRGDAITIDPWFVEGHSTAGVIDRIGNRVLLDWAVPLKAGDVAVFRDRKGREWGPVSIVGVGEVGEEIVLDQASLNTVAQDTGVSFASILDGGRGDMTAVRFGALSVMRESYLIQTIQMTGARKANATAVINDPRVWEAIGQDIVTPPDGAGGLADPEVPRILGLTANAVQMAAGLRCDYAIMPGRGAKRFEVGVSYDGVRFDTTANAEITGSISLNPVDPQIVTVRARAFGSTDMPGPYFIRPLSLGQSNVLGSLLDDLSVEIEKLSAEAQAEIASINDLGRGALALGRDAMKDALVSADEAKHLAEEALAQATRDTAGALRTADDTIRGAIRQIEEVLNRFGDATATEMTNAYKAREFIKLGTQKNFAAIERLTELRLSDNEAFAGITTSLAVRLTIGEGNIVANATAIQGLYTTVTNINGVVTAQSQSITNLGSRLDTNDGKLSAQATAVQQLTTRVTINEGNISSYATSLTTLQSEVKDQSGRVLATSRGLDSLTTRVEISENSIVSISARTVVLESQVNYANGQIAGNATAINSLTTRVTGTEQYAETLTQSLTNLASTVYNQGQTITATSQALDSLTTRTKSSEDRIESEASKLTALTSTVSDEGAKTYGNTLAIQSLQTRVSSAEGTITSEASKLESLTATVGDEGAKTYGNTLAILAVQSRVTASEGRIEATAQSVTALTATVQEEGAKTYGNTEAILSIQTRVTANEQGITANSNFLTYLNSVVGNNYEQQVANAQATSRLETRASNIEGQVSSQATSIQSLSSNVGSNNATLTAYGTSIDGIKVQFGVTGYIDGNAGGFVFTGVKKLDGSASFSLKITGDVFVDGTITARTLAAENLIVRTGQIGDLVIATRSIGYRQITNVTPVVSDSQRAEVMITVRDGTQLAFWALAVNGPQAELNANIAPGSFNLIRGEDYSVFNIPNPAVYTGSGDSRRLRILQCPLIAFDAPGPGTYKYTAVTSAGAGQPGVILLVIEYMR